MLERAAGLHAYKLTNLTAKVRRVPIRFVHAPDMITQHRFMKAVALTAKSQRSAALRNPVCGSLDSVKHA